MQVWAKEPQQYRSTYTTFRFPDVKEIKVSKDGKYTTLVFDDGYKSRRMTKNIVKVEY